MRKTKIVATIGPASNNKETLKAMMQAGMNTARLNFSHGTHEFHGTNIKMIREVAEELKLPIAILADLQGPKIRTGLLKNKEVLLKKGERFTFTSREVEGDDKEVSITYKELPKEIKVKEHFFVDDGLMEFEVVEIKNKEDIICEVIVGGILKNSKGMNLPDTELSTPALTDDDKEDLIFVIQHDVDYVALSFVRSPDDIHELKTMIARNGADIPVIAKIEHPKALTCIDAIIDIADGIMIARGDLGVELPFEDVPIIQKDLIVRCMKKNKPVITATQMLESMITNKRPTRAEVTDVTCAILEGTDAIMLSGETASGKYPVEAVEVMARIAFNTEKEIGLPDYDFQAEQNLDESAISYAVKAVSEHLNAKLIVALTMSGVTAKLISQKRPPLPIIALTSNPKIRRRMALYWGVIPYTITQVSLVTQLIEESRKVIKDNALAPEGSWMVLTGGLPLGKATTTNALIVEKV